MQNKYNIKDYGLEGAVEYHYGQFPPKSLDYEKLINPLGSAASAIAKYDAALNNLHNKQLLLAPLKNKEAVISSRIEGTVATLDELLTFDAYISDKDDTKEQQIYRNEIIEVHAYTRAISHAFKRMSEGLPISSRLIREAHDRMLFLGRGADKQPGKFKLEQNFIADKTQKKILFVPISADKLEDGVKNLENYINDPVPNPLLATAISHAEFEALHPFKDGNGRIGRMLITLTMWDKHLIEGPYFYISGYFENHREEYIERLRRISSNGEWTEWCIFFLEALANQANENIETTQKVSSLYDKMKERFREALASQWLFHALDFVFERPVFSTTQFKLRSGIPNQTASRFTKALAENGLLKVVIPGAGRRPTLYSFEPLLEIVRG
ncbi:Fic/DOC family N-terminal domain-containing protein [Nisaea sp.]|uniref:Fic family protein n=1 Tax=Nisaea sp. TaxID=2024842 RepID=UPI00329A3D34